MIRLGAVIGMVASVVANIPALYVAMTHISEAGRLIIQAVISVVESGLIGGVSAITITAFLNLALWLMGGLKFRFVLETVQTEHTALAENAYAMGKRLSKPNQKNKNEEPVPYGMSDAQRTFERDLGDNPGDPRLR